MKKTTEINNLVRPELLKLKPYVSPSYAFERKMDLNESPFDLPPEVKQEIFSRLETEPWQRYHDELERPLKETLARYTGHTPEGVLIGNGSNELIFHALLAAVPRGGTVIYPEPSFSLYHQNAAVLGAEPVPFRLAPENFSVDPETVIELAEKKRAGAVILCSPNNPTGNRVPNEVIERIARGVRCVVAVDEAYMQFAEEHALPLLAKCPNLIILRTFSKAFGLAGMRFGYSLCCPELAAQTAKVQLPHHVNFFTQTAALTLLQHPGLIEKRVEDIKRERNLLGAQLNALPGIKACPSEANFILVELESKKPGAVFEALLEKGILVRNISNYPGLSRCLRVTVGPPEDNRALVAALGEVLR
jgi:histidinol-phosphate aminotransferase